MFYGSKISVLLTLCSVTAEQKPPNMKFERYPDETPENAVQQMMLGCVEKKCNKQLTSCNKNNGDCAKRVRCVFQSRGNYPSCFTDLDWDHISDHEVLILDCAQESRCVRPGQPKHFHEAAPDGSGSMSHDYDHHHTHGFPSSLLEEQIQKRNLQDQRHKSGMTAEDAAVEELRNVLREHSMNQVHDAVAIAKTISQHHAKMDAVEALVGKSEKMLEDVKNGKAGDQHEANEKLYQLMAQLESAMQTMNAEAKSKRHSKEMMQNVLENGAEVELENKSAKQRLLEKEIALHNSATPTRVAAAIKKEGLRMSH